MKTNGLELAPSKTEAVILTGKRAREDAIRPKRAEKYLGVWLDDRLSSIEHVRRVIVKSEKSVRAISRILPNVGGPRNEKRKVLYGVMKSS